MRSVILAFPVFDEVLLADVPKDAVVGSCYDVVADFVIPGEGGMRAVSGFLGAVHYTTFSPELYKVHFRVKDILPRSGAHKENCKLISPFTLEVKEFDEVLYEWIFLCLSEPTTF